MTMDTALEGWESMVTETEWYVYVGRLHRSCRLSDICQIVELLDQNLCYSPLSVDSYSQTQYFFIRASSYPEAQAILRIIEGQTLRGKPILSIMACPLPTIRQHL